MRVLLDTNILISYLLDQTDEKLKGIVEGAIRAQYTLIIPQELLDELANALTTKPYLIKHIPKDTSDRFIHLITTVAEIHTPITDVLPNVSRDIKDDYLFAYALVGQADYIVSGDQDVLAVKKMQKIAIISPSQFYDLLTG